MKIALPTRNQQIDDHFGHCEYYTVYTLGEHQNVTATETLPSSEGCGCKSDIAAVLEQKGVTLMLAGNMGEGARQVLERHHIRVIRGCSGAVEEVLAAYLAGKLSDSGTACSSGDEHHCSHQAPLTFKVL